MENTFLTIKENEYTAELVEKKSKFIAKIVKVNSEEEAMNVLKSIKKEHRDARHNVFAYRIANGSERFSDDGEPSGTAGRPMLDVLLGEEIHDVAVVVTRYFGGTLLGTGGLVRAYQGATKAGIEASTVIMKMHGQKIRIQTDYTGLGKIQYILGQKGLTILNSEYTDQVALEVLLPEDDIKPVMADITEGTNGQAKMELLEECYFANVDGEMMIFED